MEFLIWLTCFALIATGLIFGWWRPIVEWWNGGETQIKVDPIHLGQRRHSLEYVSSHVPDYLVRRPIVGTGVLCVGLA